MNRNYLNSHQVNKLFYLLSFTVAFDALNGAITMYSPGILEMIIPVLRVCFVAYFMKLLLEINGQKGLRVLFLSTLFISSILFISLLNSYNSFSLVFEDVMYGIKLLNFFILSNLLFEISKSIDFDWFNKILLNNVYLITLLIIVPTQLNLARQTYVNSNLGSMGFYIANNSTNITLVMLIFFLIYNIWFNIEKKKINIFFFALSIISLWMQATKTSYFIIVICLILNLFLYFKIFIFKRENKFRIILYFILFLLISILFYLLNYKKIDDWFNYLFQDFYIRQQYQMKRFSGNKLLYLTSGRVHFLENIFDRLKDENNIINWFFGVGISTLKNTYGKITEMDLFDIFFATGFLGIYFTYIHTFILVKKNKYNKFSEKYFFILVVVVLGYSIVAGHVYVDIISTTVFAISLASINSLKNLKENYLV